MAIDKDLLLKSREKNEEQKEKFKEAQLKKIEEIQRVRELMCKHCQKWILTSSDEDTIYYQCIRCGELFCYACAQRKGNFRSTDSLFAKCKCNRRNRDSQWDRKVIPKDLEEQDLNKGSLS